ELNLRARHAVHFPRGPIDEPAKHLALGLQFHQGPLDGLIARQWFSERLARVCVVDALVDAKLSSANARSGLPDSVLVHEVSCQNETVVDGSEDRTVRHEDILE